MSTKNLIDDLRIGWMNRDRCMEAADKLEVFEALGRRVHAERGPFHNGGRFVCLSCDRDAITDAHPINHKPDCLWLAADAMKKAGMI